MTEFLLGGFVVIVLLAVAVIYVTKIKPVSSQMYGGIAANLESMQCPKYFICKHEAAVPDSSGTCVFPFPSSLMFTLIHSHTRQTIKFCSL